MTGLSKEQLEVLKPTTDRPKLPDGMFAPMRSPQDALELAYGLLWCVPVDLRTGPGRLVSMARKALLAQLDRDGQGRGITAARATIS